MKQYENKTIEQTRKQNCNKYWNISLKHSNMIRNNIDNIHLYDVIDSVYGSYILMLKTHKLEKYKSPLWDELMNVSKKNNLNKVRNSIYKLNLTNIYNTNKKYG